MLKVLKEHICSSHQHPNVEEHDCKEKKIYEEWSHDSVPCGNVWSGCWSNQNNQTNVSGHALCQENRSKKFMKLERDLVRFFVCGYSAQMKQNCFADFQWLHK